MQVLHHYHPGTRPDDQVACWRGLKLCEELEGVRVAHEASSGPYHYAETLEHFTRSGDDLVVVEQDLCVLPQHLLDFGRCLHPLCVFAYYIYPVRDGVVTPEVVHRNCPSRVDGPIHEGDRWAREIGLGLARIRPEALREVASRPRVPRVPWSDLSSALSVRIGRSWHVHWPAVVHHHLGR